MHAPSDLRFASFPAADSGQRQDIAREALAETPANALDLAGFRSVWDATEVEYSPALEFLFPRTSAVLPLSYSGGEKT